MNDRELRRLEMFGRVITFGRTHAADFAADSVATLRFDNLRQIVVKLDEAKARQRRDGATSKAVLLDALRLDVQNITRAARAMDQDEAGLADKLPTPKTVSDADLVTAADAILDKLSTRPGDDAPTRDAKAVLVAKFVAHEFPADFVQALQHDREAIGPIQSAIDADEADGVASTAAIGLLIRAGMKEVTYLDAIAHIKYTRHADLLRAWTSASHIDRLPHRTKPAPAPAPALTPA